MSADKSPRMQEIERELDATRAVCAALDGLADDAARTRVLAAIICLYDTEAARAVLARWRRLAA